MPDTAGEQAALTVTEIKRNAAALGLVWDIRAATVTDYEDSVAFAIFDGEDTFPVPMISLIGTLLPDERVMVFSVPPSGNYIIASQLQHGAIGRAFRTTTSSSTSGTTELPVLRLDDLPIFAGRRYRVATPTSLVLNSTIANDLIEFRLRVALGSVATISSTLFAVKAGFSRTASGNQYTAGVMGEFTMTSSGIGSVLLTVTRAVGTGSASIVSNSTYPIAFTVEDLGPDPGDTGVDL